MQIANILAQSNHNIISTTNKHYHDEKESTIEYIEDNANVTTDRRQMGRVPRGFNLYRGTKEEEIETLKLVFRVDGSSLYGDGAVHTI